MFEEDFLILKEISKLSDWTLKRLLVGVERYLSEVLPVEVKILEPGKGYPLKFGDRTVASIVLSEDDFYPGELSRWKSTILRLAQEVFARLYNESVIDGLPGPGFLKDELCERELRGLLIEGIKPELKKAYAISHSLYFIPEDEISIRDILYAFWAEGKEFVAATVRISSIEELYEAKNFLLLAKTFGFTWLSRKAAKFLADELGLTEKVQDELQVFEEALKEDMALALFEGQEEVIDYVIRQSHVFRKIGATRVFIASKLKIEELLSLAEELELTGGLYAGGALLPPCAAVLAAFEHSRRLKEPRPVVFSPFTYHVAGDLYTDLGDLGAALKCYLIGKDGTAQPVDLLNSLAVIMLQLNKRAEAQKFLEEAISLSPNDPLLYYNLGLFLKQEESPHAEKYFAKAYQLDPHNEIFALAQAEIFAKKNNWEKVKEILSDKLNSPRGLFLFAKACYELGDLREAFSRFKEVVRLDPKNAQALAYLALLFFQLEGEKEIAKSLVSQAMAIDPEKIRPLWSLLMELLN